ncbi:hypothetical protein [Yoonia sp.]|jgi:hypothetical protein|uniref:hypothetical protein n=1 Tax=Yoonia sp. TaxID=2212373 RepID=UPI0023A1F67A|nr:hypothetical protein [Yoonia sp.]MDE0851675.1 hypothetical protein [Yoonia sp.]
MKTAYITIEKRNRVSGVVAHGPRPTKLAAALIATAISIPFGIIVGLVDLLT